MSKNWWPILPCSYVWTFAQCEELAPICLVQQPGYCLKRENINFWILQLERASVAFLKNIIMTSVNKSIDTKSYFWGHSAILALKLVKYMSFTYLFSEWQKFDDEDTLFKIDCNSNFISWDFFQFSSFTHNRENQNM